MSGFLLYKLFLPFVFSDAVVHARLCIFYMEKFHCMETLFQVLDGSESQYSGMQIGTLQDEEDEGTASSSQEEPSEPFLPSALGVFLITGKALCT